MKLKMNRFISIGKYLTNNPRFPSSKLLFRENISLFNADGSNFSAKLYARSARNFDKLCLY